MFSFSIIQLAVLALSAVLANNRNFVNEVTGAKKKINELCDAERKEALEELEKMILDRQKEDFEKLAAHYKEQKLLYDKAIKEIGGDIAQFKEWRGRLVKIIGIYRKALIDILDSSTSSSGLEEIINEKDPTIREEFAKLPLDTKEVPLLLRGWTPLTLYLDRNLSTQDKICPLLGVMLDKLLSERGKFYLYHGGNGITPAKLLLSFSGAHLEKQRTHLLKRIIRDAKSAVEKGDLDEFKELINIDPKSIIIHYRLVEKAINCSQSDFLKTVLSYYVKNESLIKRLPNLLYRFYKEYVTSLYEKQPSESENKLKNLAETVYYFCFYVDGLPEKPGSPQREITKYFKKYFEQEHFYSKINAHKTFMIYAQESISSLIILVAENLNKVRLKSQQDRHIYDDRKFLPYKVPSSDEAQPYSLRNWWYTYHTKDSERCRYALLALLEGKNLLKSVQNAISNLSQEEFVHMRLYGGWTPLTLSASKCIETGNSSAIPALKYILNSVEATPYFYKFHGGNGINLLHLFRNKHIDPIDNEIGRRLYYDERKAFESKKYKELRKLLGIHQLFPAHFLERSFEHILTKAVEVNDLAAAKVVVESCLQMKSSNSCTTLKFIFNALYQAYEKDLYKIVTIQPKELVRLNGLARLLQALNVSLCGFPSSIEKHQQKITKYYHSHFILEAKKFHSNFREELSGSFKEMINAIPSHRDKKNYSIKSKRARPEKVTDKSYFTKLSSEYITTVDTPRDGNSLFWSVTAFLQTYKGGQYQLCNSALEERVLALRKETAQMLPNYRDEILKSFDLPENKHIKLIANSKFRKDLKDNSSGEQYTKGDLDAYIRKEVVDSYIRDFANTHKLPTDIEIKALVWVLYKMGINVNIRVSYEEELPDNYFWSHNMRSSEYLRLKESASKTRGKYYQLILINKYSTKRLNGVNIQAPKPTSEFIEDYRPQTPTLKEIESYFEERVSLLGDQYHHEAIELHKELEKDIEERAFLPILLESDKKQLSNNYKKLQFEEEQEIHASIEEAKRAEYRKAHHNFLKSIPVIVAVTVLTGGSGTAIAASEIIQNAFISSTIYTSVNAVVYNDFRDLPKKIIRGALVDGLSNICAVKLSGGKNWAQISNKASKEAIRFQAIKQATSSALEAFYNKENIIREGLLGGISGGLSQMAIGNIPSEVDVDGNLTWLEDSVRAGISAFVREVVTEGGRPLQAALQSGARAALERTLVDGAVSGIMFAKDKLLASICYEQEPKQELMLSLDDIEHVTEEEWEELGVSKETADEFFACMKEIKEKAEDLIRKKETQDNPHNVVQGANSELNSKPLTIEQKLLGTAFREAASLLRPYVETIEALAEAHPRFMECIGWFFDGLVVLGGILAGLPAGPMGSTFGGAEALAIVKLKNKLINEGKDYVVNKLSYEGGVDRNDAAIVVKAVSIILSAGKLWIGTSFGRLGTVIKNPNIKISKLDENAHYLTAKINRMVPSKDVIDTLKKPLVVLKQNNDRFLYLSEKAAVVVNKNGKVITAYGSKNFDKKVLEVIQKAKK